MIRFSVSSVYKTEDFFQDKCYNGVIWAAGLPDGRGSAALEYREQGSGYNGKNNLIAGKSGFISGL